MLKGKRDPSESIGQSMRDRETLHRILERKAEPAIGGENEAQKIVLEMEAEVENRRWEQRSSEIAQYESFRELESQRPQLQQANFWAENAHRERINLCGQLEMRNQLFQEIRTKDYREIEELRSRCH